MTCRIVGAHKHQRRKRLRRTFLSRLSIGEWIARKFLERRGNGN